MPRAPWLAPSEDDVPKVLDDDVAAREFGISELVEYCSDSYIFCYTRANR